MHSYTLVITNTWNEILTYRVNFVMWRMRNIIQLAGTYALWLTLLAQGDSIFGYTREMLITYILGVYLITSIVASTRTTEIGTDILNGNLSNYLIRPLNYFGYYIARDIGDKFANILLTLGELTILFLLIHPVLFIQTNILILLGFLLALFLALCLQFILYVLVSILAFWSDDVWGIRFIYLVVASFFMGAYFPLDMLPEPFFSIFQALPFQYLLYFPLKIYLGEMPLMSFITGMLVCLLWIIVLYLVTKMLWQKGIKSYTAYGR
ncbi:MAG: ABC-2 family transporter protein [Patescibacteria group bacterium]